MGNRKYHIASCWWISSSEKCNTLWSVMIMQQQNHRTWRTSRFDSADRKRAGSWRSVSKRDDEKMRERYVKHFKCVGALIDTNCIDVQTANLNCETRTLFWGRYLLLNNWVFSTILPDRKNGRTTKLGFLRALRCRSPFPTKHCQLDKAASQKICTAYINTDPGWISGKFNGLMEM